MLVQEFLHEHLEPLLKNFFGRKREDFTLKQQHHDCLRKLIKAAWDWNLKLKEEVILLGDYSQTAYIPRSRFEAAFMEEFQPNSNPIPDQPQPTSILGTLALGLVSRRAVGGECPPEETVVCKAVVATDCLYA